MRAVEAFSKALNTKPILAMGDAAWGGIVVCDWKLPWLDGFELAQNDDFIIAYHSAGSHRVRASCAGPWSATTSIPGMTSFIPPDSRVEYSIDGRVSFCSIHIPRRLLSGLLGSDFSDPPRFRFALDDTFARGCVEIMLHQARQSDYCNFPYVHSVTRALLRHVIESGTTRAVRSTARARPDARPDSELDDLLDFIEARLGEPLSLDTLAQQLAVSRAHLVRRFRMATGISPHRYLLLRRIDRAKHLLRERSVPLADIALAVGFSSQSHFTQAFRATAGQTPSRFRAGADDIAAVSGRGESEKLV
jgi:AraC family transcriptional regulator